MRQAGARAFLQLAVFLFTPSVLGCGSTLELSDRTASDSVFPPVVFPGSSDAGLAGDAATPLPYNFSCDTMLPSGVCGAAQVGECFDTGTGLLTRIDPLDCDLSRGLTGDAKTAHADCEQAFLGQSGDGCAKPFVCARRAALACCLEFAACGEPELTLLRTRACAQICPSAAAMMSATIESCKQLSAAATSAESLNLLVGLPCSGDFMCDDAFEPVSPNPLPWSEMLRIYFCVGQQVQIMTTLPSYAVPLP